MKKFICLVLTLIISALCLFSCGSVSVELNGGNIDMDISEEVSIKDVLDKTPTKDGYIFGGWYSDKQLTKLVTEDSEDLNKVDKLYAKWITADPKIYEVRNDLVKITDSGRKNQQLDIVYLSKDYDYQGLKYAGYTELKIEFTFSIYEIDDGYQYVFLYSDKNCVDTSSLDYFISNKLFGKTPDDPSLLCSYRFEHGSGYKESTRSNYSFTAYVSLDDMKDDLYIRYGASGNSDDDWYNSNVFIKVTPIK